MKNQALSPVSADLLRPRTMLAVVLILMVVSAFGLGIVWSTRAAIVEVSTGQGRVIPSGRIRQVQNLEGGIVQVIHVEEGAQVKRGDALISIDPIQAGATLAENQANIEALEATIAWLSASLMDEQPDFSAVEDATIIARNRTEYRSTLEEHRAALRSIAEQLEQKRLEQAETKAALANTNAALDVAREQVTIVDRLQKSRAASRSEFLTAKARLVELEGRAEALSLSLPRLAAAAAEAEAKRAEQTASFRARLSTRLNDASAKLAVLKQTVAVDADRVERAELRSPVNGIVKTLFANTIGQVMKPAESVVEIVPLEDKLLVRVEISPKDIAFLHQGQKAVIKLTAYDYAIYGALEGKVVRVGADSIVDDRGNTHFPVDVEANTSWIEQNGERLPVLPGMVAQVDVVTGSKTVFDYITKPIHRTATGAFGER